MWGLNKPQRRECWRLYYLENKYFNCIFVHYYLLSVCLLTLNWLWKPESCAVAAENSISVMSHGTKLFLKIPIVCITIMYYHLWSKEKVYTLEQNTAWERLSAEGRSDFACEIKSNLSGIWDLREVISSIGTPTLNYDYNIFGDPGRTN